MNSTPVVTEQKSVEDKYVRSFLYQGSYVPPPMPKMHTQKQSQKSHEPSQNKTQMHTAILQQKSLNSSFDGKMQQEKLVKSQDKTKQPSLLASSFEVIKNQMMKKMLKGKEEQPIYLIGDLDAPSDPFILLLARALSAHFEYPKIAGELGIRGRVILAMTINLDGSFSDVEMLSSSSNNDLDAAALYAVNSAPRVIGVERFIPKSKRIVIGFIFR